MKKKILIKFGSLVLLVVFIVVTMVLIVNQVKALRCSGVEVFFKEKEHFVSEKAISNIVFSSTKGLMGSKLKTLNTQRIEQQVRKHPWVKSAEVYVGFESADKKFFKGGVKVKVDQREPYYRYVTSGGGYYVDKEGYKMPFSRLHTVDVMVVTGRLTPEIAKGELMTLLEYIYDDTYLKSLFEQVHIRGNGEFVLVPRVGGHLVELGFADDLDRKFRHLQALYEDGFNGSDWRKYKYVSLKFRNQIVCTRS